MENNSSFLVEVMSHTVDSHEEIDILIVSRFKNESLEVLNIFRGSEASELYNEICVSKEK